MCIVPGLVAIFVVNLIKMSVLDKLNLISWDSDELDSMPLLKTFGMSCHMF